MEPLENRPAAYALQSDDKDWVYKGSTKNLAERISAHLSGKVSRTKNRRPLELIYWEYFDDYTEARRRENWLKSGQGREWLKNKSESKNSARVAKSVDARDLKSLDRKIVRVRVPPRAPSV